MTGGAARSFVAAALIIGSAGLPSGVTASGRAFARAAPRTLSTDLDQIFSDPIFARALVAVRVESLTTGGLLYQLNANKLVMPASNMKIVTMSVAAARLGWSFTYRTRLEAAGAIANGTLSGDLIVVGSGDPTIGSPDLGPAPLFLEWADALWRAGVHRVDGRLIGDARVFDTQGLGNGWAWDDLNAGYAAPSCGLSYDENTVTINARAGRTVGDPVQLDLTPGHPFDVVNELTSGGAGTNPQVTLIHALGRTQLTIRGSVPAGGAVVTRTIAVEKPAAFFLGAMQAALKSRGIEITGGAWDIDDVTHPPAADGRRVLAEHRSWPLSVIGGYFMKVSQNFYAETLLKTLASAAGEPGTIANGRRIVRDTLGAWGVPADAFVMDDGSGLSRYDYVTAGAMVAILTHMWQDDTLRGPFTSLLPVGGHDGTLSNRMKNTALDGHVEAKTGTIMNVRSLSGYLETTSGERIVFSMIANHFTAASTAVDAVVDKALTRIAER